MTLVTGIVGIVMVMMFLGVLAWWIKELPFTIIVVAAVVLLLYDFVQVLRHGDSGGGR